MPSPDLALASAVASLRRRFGHAKMCEGFAMVRSTGLMAWKGLLLVASGLWMLAIALLTRLFVEDCWPSLPPLPTSVLSAGIIAWLAIASVPIAWAPTGPAVLTRAALVSGGGSLLGATGWVIGVLRAREWIRHGVSGHHHHPVPGDVGSLLLYVYSAYALVISAPVLAGGLVIGTIWRRRRHRAASSSD